MTKPTSNSAQRHGAIPPMRGEGDHFGPNSGPGPPGTWRYQVGLSGLTALSNVRSQGQSGKHILPLSFSGFDPNATSTRRGPSHPAYDGHFDLAPPPIPAGSGCVISSRIGMV